MNKIRKKIAVIMPGYNVAGTIERTVRDIPKNLADEIIFIDDGSTDNTADTAKSLGLTVVSHKKNKGYGAAQKTGYKKALKLGADVVVMIHPDYQYDPKKATKMVNPIKRAKVDIMLGTRIHGRETVLKGGMPIYKYLGNRFLTTLENTILGWKLSEYHTGYRAFSKEVLKSLPIEYFSDDFVFDTQMMVSSAYSGFSVSEIPVPVRYFPEASSISFKRSVKYGLETLRVLLQFIAQKTHLASFKIFSDKK